MRDPLLTLIAELIAIAGIGGAALIFAVMAPTPGSWQRGLLAMRPQPPTNLPADLVQPTRMVRLTARELYVIRLAVDVEHLRLKASPCPDLSSDEQAKLLADFGALSEKLKVSA